MSNKRKQQSREVFLDFTMNDDNNLLEQINEIDKSFALNIPAEANKVTHAKVTMPVADEAGIREDSFGGLNDSLDFGAFASSEPLSLDELVKETEGLIETISETVQETAKISAQHPHIVQEHSAQPPKEQKTVKADKVSMRDSHDLSDVMFEEKVDIAADDDERFNDSDTYMPHFIKDELGELRADDEKMQNEAPLLTNSLSAEHLFDDVVDEPHDVLEQTGSFLFNTKDLHLFSKEEADDVIAHSLLNEDTKIDETKQMDAHDQVSANNLAERIEDEQETEDLIDITPLSNQAGTAIEMDKMAETTEATDAETRPKKGDAVVAEPTIVAKVEDIDVLLQKLDELSAKEMVSSLAAKNNVKRENTQDAHTPFVDVHEETEYKASAQAIERSAEQISLEVNAEQIHVPGDHEPITNVELEQAYEQNIHIELSGQDALNMASVGLDGPDMSLVRAKGMKDVAETFAEIQTTAPSMKQDKDRKIEHVYDDNTMVKREKYEESVSLPKNFYQTEDLIATQPINLREIEKLSTEPNLIASNSESDPYLVAADIPQQASGAKLLQQESQADLIEDNANLDTITGVDDAMPSSQFENLETNSMAQQPLSEQKELDISQFETNFGQVLAQVIPKERDASTNDLTADELAFEQSFEQVFAKATKEVETLAKALIQTDELMNLHEEMIGTEGGSKHLEVLTSAALPTNDIMNTRQKNQASHVINHAASLEEIEQEAKAHSIADRALQFSDQIGSEEFKHGQNIERKNHKNPAMKEMPSQNVSGTTADVKKVSNTTNISAIRPTGRTKPKTFDDTDTTLVNLSFVERVASTPKMNGSTETSTMSVHTMPNARQEQTVVKVLEDQSQKIVGQKKNQLLMITVVLLLIVILALICFIIVSKFM